MLPAIKVENLGKEYVIGSKEKGNETFREMLLSSLSAPFRRFTQSDGKSGQEERFWALKDVSFEIQPGEVVGIIGRNGAGKSTLLKILSRITEPTQGEISIRGRVASLLEVGTGFHPELTGRENIYLNGAILGMSRAEIKRKFDEIVDFSEVEKFLDTPVKRYSSGMYVRLAFAVAAHLEPEILVVDEVLAVGDAGFQKKCLGKMGDVAKQGRTVLFVSHNLGAVSELCTKGILLANGQMQTEGKVSDVIEQYVFSANENLTGEVCWDDGSMPGDSDLRLKRVSVMQADTVKRVVQDVSSIDVEFELLAHRDLVGVAINLIINNAKGDGVLHTQSNINGAAELIGKGNKIVRFTLPPLLLAAGNYTVTVGAAIPNVHSYFLERDVACFQVETCNSEVNRHPESAWKGILNPQIGEWRYL